MKIRAFLLLFLVGAALAQAQTFPGKPVRIVPFGTAGGPVDTIARLYGEKLRERWKQPVIVEPRPGASGTIAADFVAKSPPDGATFLITLSLTHINNAVLQKSIPYDPFRDFEPISLLALGYGPALVARADAPFGNMRELVAYAKGRTRGLSYGTWGNGSTPHLFSEMLARQDGIALVHVPYKGEGAAHVDLLGGSLDLAWANTGTARRQLDAGKIKVLGATGSKRSPVLADTPLFGEQGIEGFEITTWIAAFAPAKTPKPVVAELHAALRDATLAPDIAARWRDIGFEPVASTPEELARTLRADYPKWKAIIEAVGIQPE